MSPTYDTLKLPQHIQTVLVTGAGGFVGRELVKLLMKLYPKLKLITTDISTPPDFGVKDTSRLKVVKADLGDIKDVESLFEGEIIGGVFALHGIMSGGSEADFELGYAVNVDSHRNLLRTAHKHAKSHSELPKPVYVNISSLAVYGGPKCRPQDFVIPSETPLMPGTSYGTAKAIMELFAYDYGRKGYLDTRTLRLPTVAIRTGAPSTAASSFISGLIREPLQGLPAQCPIANSADDPTLNTFAVYVSRTKTVVRNIVWGLCMPESNIEKFNGWRTFNVPGISITPRQILDALLEHGGQKALDLVSYKLDPAVLAICETWGGDFDNTDSLSFGFEVDDKKTGYADAVGDFKQELQI